MKKIICHRTVSSFRKQYALLLAILVWPFAGARTAFALSINLNFNDAAMSSAGLSAADITNVHNACTFAALQFTNNYSDNVNVNITVTAVSGTGTLGQSNTSIFSFTYTTLRNSIVAEATSADDTTATGGGGSVATTDPVGGSHNWWVTRAQAKALGLISDDVTNDGTFTFGAGFSYTYDPNNRAVAGKFDFIGVAMHEFSEIMGRIPGLGDSISGSPAYLLFDLFHYTGAGTRGLTDGAGRSFSINNGTALLKAFNDASVNGGDAQDWANGTNDSFNAFSNSGVQNDLTLVDVRVMDVIGYNLSGPSSQISQPDFNGDGKADYALFNPSTHQTALWYLNNNVKIGGAFGPSLPIGWELIDAADFNSDSQPDYVLFNASTRQTAIWYISGGVHVGGAYGPTVGAGYKLLAAIDFNNDGKPDYLLYNPTTRRTAIYFLNGTAYSGSAFGPTLATGYTFVDTADFNGDGKPDIVLFNPSTHRSVIWYLSGVAYSSSVFGPTIASGYELVGTADFNGDGRPDFVLYNPSSHQTALWYLNNYVYTGGHLGPALPAGYVLAAP